MRSEPPPSDPVARGTRPAATAEALPPDEPPGVWSRFQGLRVGPNTALSVSAFQPTSGVFVFPRTTQPAATSRATNGESAGAGGLPAKATDPLVVVKPSASSRSFTPMGIPARGPGSRPAAMTSSIRPAAARARSPSTATKAFNVGLSASIRPRACPTTSRAESSPDRTFPASPTTDSSRKSMGPTVPPGTRWDNRSRTTVRPAAASGTSTRFDSRRGVGQCGPVSRPSITGAVLDHVAHAVPRWEDAWPRYVMPNEVESNDFLDRFLRSNGPGAHHLTFKVPDIAQALDHCRAHGIEPVGVYLDDPYWMEAFLHPKQATGVVVQLAQSPADYTTPPPEGFPDHRRDTLDGSTGRPTAASLVRVTHAVPRLEDGVALFAGLLGGLVEDRGEQPGYHWLDLRWDGPLALRLVAPTAHPAGRDLTEWIGDRPGRVHHVTFVAGSPDRIAGAGPQPKDLAGALSGTDAMVVEPEDNLGLRLVVTPPLLR